MRLNLESLAFLSFVAVVSASSGFGNLVVHEQREDAPDGFVNTGAAPADQVLNMRLALVNNNMDGLEQVLYDVSAHGGPLRGQYITKEEVEEFVKPTSESSSIVKEFLASNGVTSKTISPAGDWLAFSVSVSKANEMFDADFSVFQHVETGKQYVRTLAYSIPARLQGHLNLVHPTITFDNPFANLPVVSLPLTIPPVATNLTMRQTAPSSCNSVVTPACLQALYGIPTTLATQSSNVLGVSGFADQFANKADLTTFLRTLRPDLPSNTTFTLQTLDGGSNPQNPSEAGVEANLDVQYTVGLASGVPTTFISVGEDNQDGALDGFLDIINFLLGESNPPHTLTTSYGQNENTISRALATQLCNAFMQLGARGTSVLFASGDGGVAGSQSASCSTFVPTFPSGCPFMTSVGATTGVTETAAAFSAGGFSNYFTTPSYQMAAVNSYLTTLGTTNSGRFNRSGRGYPDVSAQGENIEIVVDGETGLIAGTSASSPIVASIVALLNDRLIAAGRTSLGFLNICLYSDEAQAGIKDITTGSNPGCGTNGFPALPGWDPVTGVGTPFFPGLLAATGL
ncbi:family S53 protease-like protein [Phellopilus nigrolimitatus]|nr:family S53 protease-like protein [Phellopilus nigrolimitatus]